MTSRSRWGSNRSRLTLAASIALLLLGSLALAGVLKPGVPDAPSVLDPTAKVKKDKGAAPATAPR